MASSLKSEHEYTSPDLDLLSEFPVSVGQEGQTAGATAGSDAAIQSGRNHRFVVQDLHAGGHIGHGSADENDDLMDIGDEESGFNHAHAGNLMDEDGDDDDEAMQFESVANKLFQNETQVVPLPTVDQHHAVAGISSASSSTHNHSHPLDAKLNNNSTGSSSSNNGNGNTIILPAGQTIHSAAELSNFITSIRPPSIPGTTQQQPKQTQIILQKGSVTGSSAATGIGKKPASIAPVPGSSIQLLNASSLVSANNLPTGSYKVIMTSGGQQLALLQASDLCNLTAVVKNSNTNAGKAENQQQQKAAITMSSGSGGQQIVFLSPLKSAVAGQPVKVGNVTAVAGGSGLKTLAPAPSGSVRLIQTTSSSGVNQITRDGKNLQVIRLVTSTAGGSGKSSSSTSALRTIAPSPGQKTLTLIPATSKSGGSANILTSTGGQQFLTTTSSTGNQQVIMLPASMLQAGGIMKSVTGQSTGLKVSNQSHSQPAKSYVPIAPSPLGGHVSTIHPSSKDVLAGLVKQQQQHHHHQQQQNGPVTKSVTIGSSSASASFPNVNTDDLSRQRKPCNCTKSQCLKLYCDCFANGEFCKDCNCNNCNNNLEHEEERQKAVKQCLERNPHAFQPKIGKGRITGDVPERRHTKGCNCRRSGCLKNYCECYEAKILCSELCKCCGCKNYEDSSERKSLQLMNLAEAAEYRSQQQSAASKLIWGSDYHAKLPVPLLSNDRFPCSFISTDVIDAACQCLMATVEDGEKVDMDYAGIEKSLILEFGRVLTQIIDCANRVST